jgi:hypothetical protein
MEEEAAFGLFGVPLRRGIYLIFLKSGVREKNFLKNEGLPG